MDDDDALNESAATDTTAEGVEGTNSEKLDDMMDLLFVFIQRECADTSEAGQARADDIFQTMMRIFHRMILTTHNSKFVQARAHCLYFPLWWRHCSIACVQVAS